MSYFVICIAAFSISVLALLSGFGVGTVLMPAFAIFFPLPVAVASTAVVHLANNFFKFALVGRLAKKSIVVKFGIPAAFGSAIGAYLLQAMAKVPPLAVYSIANHRFNLTLLGFFIGLIIVFFSFFELVPRFSKLAFPSKYISLGGFFSGFFGGISGNQGVFRSAFLIKSGLTKEQFIGTGVVCSIIVDVIRIFIYGWAFYIQKFFFATDQNMNGILIAATLSAFLGSYLGTLLMRKVTFRSLEIIVGGMLFVLGIAIASGLI